LTAGKAPTVGIIGLGFGRHHIEPFRANGCRVVAVCQRDAAAAHAVAQRYQVPQVFDRWQDLIDQAKPDIVSIATPPVSHLSIALHALSAGCHVLCEKPLAMSVEEARSMAAAAARAGKVGMIGFNWRFTRAMQRFHDMVTAGALGRIFHIAVRAHASRWADENIVPTWRTDSAQAGHGALGDLGVHVIDMIRWNFGEIRRVCALTGIAYKSGADDFANVFAELSAGAPVALTVSRVSRGSNETTIEAYGSRGALAYRLARAESGRWYEGELRTVNSGTMQAVDLGAPEPEIVGSDPHDVGARATITPLIGRLLSATKTGARGSPSFEDGVKAQAILEAIATSAARQKWIDVV
jgi:predicted dehydrogenase